MSIKLDETSLTASQYNALAQRTSPPAWTLVAHKVNLDFENDTFYAGAPNTTSIPSDHLFDAAYYSFNGISFLCRLSDGKLSHYSKTSFYLKNTVLNVSFKPNAQPSLY